SRPLWDRIVGERRRHFWPMNQAMAARFVNALQGMPVLRAFGAQDRFGRTLASDAEALCAATVDSVKVTLLHTGFGSFAVALGTAVAVGVGALLFVGGHIGAFAVILLLFLSAEALRPIMALSQAFHAGYGGVLASEAIADFLADSGEETPARGSPSLPGAPEKAPIGAAIAVEAATF